MFFENALKSTNFAYNLYCRSGVRVINDELRNELIASLNYSVDNIEPAKGFIEINVLQHKIS